MKSLYEIRGDITAIFLNRKDGSCLETIIDTSDLPSLLLLNVTWHAIWYKNTKSFYAIANYRLESGKWTALSLHRVIMNSPKELFVDHVTSGETLDNRRKNLRLATRSENGSNRKGSTVLSKTGVRGVNWHKENGKWVARVRVNKKCVYSESFDDLKEAEVAVKRARAKFMPFSEEARLSIAQ